MACPAITKEPMHNTGNSCKSKTVSFGLSVKLSLSQQHSLIWPNLWRKCGKLQDGKLFKVMYFTLKSKLTDKMKRD